MALCIEGSRWLIHEVSCEFIIINNLNNCNLLLKNWFCRSNMLGNQLTLYKKDLESGYADQKTTESQFEYVAIVYVSLFCFAYDEKSF